MPGQNTSFHQLLTRIAAGTKVLSAPEDVDTAQQLISFGYAKADFIKTHDRLTYTEVTLTNAGRSYLDEQNGAQHETIR